MGIARTLRSLPRRISESIELEGLWGFGFRVFVSPVYRAIVLGAIPLDAYLRDAVPLQIAVRTASDEDIERLAMIRPELAPATLRARLRDGHECFVGVLDTTSVGFSWATVGEARLGDIGLALSLRDDELLQYDIFVHPAHRGAGVFKAVSHAFEEEWLRRGFHTRVGVAAMGRAPYAKNRPYMVATVRTLRLGPFRKFWVRTYGPQAEYWRERLKELRWA
jgi:GNAT superfamily N-acetyltransferase